MQGLGKSCLYCGDGINDLEALANADVGMAVGSAEASAAATFCDTHYSIAGQLLTLHSVCASILLLYSFLLYSRLLYSFRLCSFLLYSFLLYSFLLYSFLLYSFHLRLICLRLCFWRFCALHSRPSGKCHAGMLQFLACALVHEQSHAPHPQM